MGNAGCISSTVSLIQGVFLKSSKLGDRGSFKQVQSAPHSPSDNVVAATGSFLHKGFCNCTGC